MGILLYNSFLTNYFNNCIITLAFQNAAMAQVVEHVLGKDEVTGSNPVSSSKNTGISFGISVFLFIITDLNPWVCALKNNSANCF